MPHLERLENGDAWYCDGRRITGTGGATQTGVRFEDQTLLTQSRPIEEVRLGAWIPEEHVKDMDEDGVDASIIFPTVGLNLYENVPDSDLMTEICRIYNDWLAEFCKAIPDRLKGVAMLNIDEVRPGLEELERCAKMGMVGAMITVYLLPGRNYDLPEYDLLWAAAQDLQMPLALHFTTARPQPGQEPVGGEGGMTPAFMCNIEHWVRMSLAHIIFSGVFQRFPKLQIGSVENELSWAPNFIDRMDYTYTQRTPNVRPGRSGGNGLPATSCPANTSTATSSSASKRTAWASGCGTSLEWTI